MPLPYLPPGQASLPAERFILFADGDNQVQRIDETATAKDGVAFTGEWQSPTLNQVEDAKEYSLTLLELWYAANATTISVSASGDGGETWSAPQVVNVLATPERIARIAVGFDDVTGFDVRFRIQLDTIVLANIYGYRPHLVDRGDLIF